MSDNGGNFSNLNKYINEMMYDIIMSPNISRILTYTDSSMYGKEPPTNPFELLYKNVFPYGFIPDVQTEVGSYITIEFDDFRLSKNSEFKNGFVVVSTFCHTDIVKTNYGSRLLLLYEEVDKLFNERKMGVGLLNFLTCKKIPTLKDPFYGHYLVYKLTDFNTKV